MGESRGDGYEEVIRSFRQRGPERMGPMTSWAWRTDPKRLAFQLSRYKFVAKMVDGRRKVLEAGCGDGFGTRIVAQHVGSITAVDLSSEFIESARQSVGEGWPITFRVHDLLEKPAQGSFDAAYTLDVLEHIPEESERRFLSNLIEPLVPNGICIVGIPSLQSQPYASDYSRAEHVNCKDQGVLKALMLKFFHNVFIFSMNDEVVHTGFHAMAHYNLALCCGKRLG